MKLKDLIIKSTLAAFMAGLFFTPVVSNAAQGNGAATGMGQYCIDVDGDGIGDVQPTPGTGKGRNANSFIDNNNNGICDTYENGGANKQNQYGPKMNKSSQLNSKDNMFSKNNGQGNGKGIRQQKKDGSCQVSLNDTTINLAATKQQQRKKDQSCRV